MCVPGTERISSGKLRTSTLRHSDTESQADPTRDRHAGVSLRSGYALPPADPGAHFIQIDAPTILIVAAHIRGRQVDVDHLDCRHLGEQRARREARRQRSQPLLQRDLQAVGQKRNENVGFDPRVGLMINRPNETVLNLV